MEVDKKMDKKIAATAGIFAVIVAAMAMGIWKGTPAYLSAMLMLALMIAAIAGRRNRQKAGGSSPKYRKVVSGRSDVLRPVSLEEQIVSRRKEPAVPRVRLDGDTVTILDSNVILGAVGFNNGTPNEKLLEFARSHPDWLMMCDIVKGEVDTLLLKRGGTNEMYRRLAAFEGIKTINVDYAGELAALEAYQLQETGMLSGLAINWLYEKQYDVRDILESHHPVRAPDGLKREALKKIYQNAAKDRKILAKAMALARQEADSAKRERRAPRTVILVTSDQDIHLFGQPECLAGPGNWTVAEPAELILLPEDEQEEEEKQEEKQDRKDDDDEEKGQNQ